MEANATINEECIMLKSKQPYNPDRRVFYAIVLSSIILLILVILTVNPSAGEGFINILDATKTTVIIVSICFIASLGCFLIYEDNKRGYKKFS